MRLLEVPATLDCAPMLLPVDELRVEAARYAVLRRLAPALRHHLVRPLQPMTLIYSVMHHKLSAATPDIKALQTQADKINELAKAALTQCIDISSWMAPEPGITIELQAGVMECVGLVATTLHFRGFHLVNEVGDEARLVQQDSLRMVLIAALFEITDELNEPATVTLGSTCRANELVLSLQVNSHDQGTAESYDDGYRKMVWSDVQALATSEGVGLAREHGCVTLRFPMTALHAVA